MSGFLFKRIAIVTGLVAACLSAGVAFAATPPGNSRANSAVLDATNLAPGDSRSSTVTITNRDGEPASFRLAKYGLKESPGRGGGMLSDRLELRVEDVTDQAAPTSVFSGALAAMPRQALGTYKPDESRTYRFTITFADRRAALHADLPDNAYMGGSLSLGFHWRSKR
jgi:hypothetical protein